MPGVEKSWSSKRAFSVLRREIGALPSRDSRRTAGACAAFKRTGSASSCNRYQHTNDEYEEERKELGEKETGEKRAHAAKKRRQGEMKYS